MYKNCGVSDMLSVEKESLFNEKRVESQTDPLDDDLKACELKKKNLEKEILDLKRKINVLDNKLRHMDDAVINYQKIFKEDMTYLIKQEWVLDNYRKDLFNKKNVTNKKSSFLDKFKR